MRFRSKLLHCAITWALGSAASGTVCSAEPKANTKPLWLSETTTDIAIAVSGNKSDTFLAVWNQYDCTPNAGECPSLLYGRYLGKGTLDDSKFKLAEAAANEVLTMGPKSVAMNPRGDAVICWKALNFEYVQKIACRLVPQHSTRDINTPTILVNSARFPLEPPVVAMDDGGDFIVVWRSPDGLLARRFAADGSAKENEFVISANWPPFISVAMDQDGDAVVVWKEDNHIVARRVAKEDKDGLLSRPAFRVDSTPPNDLDASDFKTRWFALRFPSVAMDRDGNFAVAWTRYLSDTKIKKQCRLVFYEGYLDQRCTYVEATVSSTGIFAQRFDVNDQALNRNKKNPALIEDIGIRFNKKQTHDYPDISMDTSGNFAVSWQQQLTHKYGFIDSDGHKQTALETIGNTLYARRYNRLKNTLEGPVTVIKKSKRSRFNSPPSIALLDDGSFGVGWIMKNYIDHAIEEKATARFIPGKH